MLIYCDSQYMIAIAKNNSYNVKNRHVQQIHNVVKLLLKCGTLSINYIKLGQSLKRGN